MNAWRRAIGAGAFLALPIGLRLGFGTDAEPGIRGDQTLYIETARRLLADGLLAPDRGKGPAYSAYLAFFSVLSGLGFDDRLLLILSNSLLDAVSLLLMLRLGRRILGSSEIGVFFGVLFVGLSPVFYGGIAAAVTESFSVTAFLGFLELWTRPRRGRGAQLAAGLCLGVLALARDQYLLFPAFLAAVTLGAARLGRRGALPWRELALLLAGAYLPSLLWAVRTAVAGGHLLHMQHGLFYYAVLPSWIATKIPPSTWSDRALMDLWENHPWSDVFTARAGPERVREVSALVWAELSAYLRDHPLEYAGMLARKTLHLWVMGFKDPFNYVWTPPYLKWIFILGSCVPVLLFGAIGLVRQWLAKPGEPAARACLAQLAVAAYVTGVTLPINLDARYSIVPHVCFGIWMGYGLEGVLRWMAGRASGGKRSAKP